VGYSVYDLPVAILWLAWLAYWTIAARNVKATRRQESWISRLITVVPIVLTAVLLVSRNRNLPWLNVRFLPPAMVFYWLGLLITALGLGFAMWARIHLGRNWSGTVTVKDDHELIRSGPYGLVRHPIYSGLLLAILGTALAFGEWRGLLAFGCLSVAFVLKLRREESFMAEAFPTEYPRYRTEVPALIPFVRATHQANSA
jgi:protein-S-isoprenylcysteine O-methyltransferase Ste14